MTWVLLRDPVQSVHYAPQAPRPARLGVERTFIPEVVDRSAATRQQTALMRREPALSRDS